MLTYNGYNVWQSDVDERVHLVDPAHERILFKKDGVKMVGNSLRAEDPVSKVYITCDDGMGPDLVLAHLSKKTWATVI